MFSPPETRVAVGQVQRDAARLLQVELHNACDGLDRKDLDDHDDGHRSGNDHNDVHDDQPQQPQVRNVPWLDRLPDPSKEGAGKLHREQQQHHVVQMSQAVQEATRVDALLIRFPNRLASGSADSV